MYEALIKHLLWSDGMFAPSCYVHSQHQHSEGYPAESVLSVFSLPTPPTPQKRIRDAPQNLLQNRINVDELPVSKTMEVD